LGTNRYTRTKKEDKERKIIIFESLLMLSETFLKKKIYLKLWTIWYPHTKKPWWIMGTLWMRYEYKVYECMERYLDRKKLQMNQGAERNEQNWKQTALADIFETYQKELKERWLIDFSDMILQAINLVEKNEIIRMNLAENYQCIMIDEFQDTNEAQMRLIQGITSVNTENPNIFAVGDDDQSIYKFQWANTKNIRDFHDNYKDTKLIILEKNYRSKNEIITLWRTVIKSELNNIWNIFPWAVKKFEAIREENGEVKRLRFKNEVEEISWIISDIERKVVNGGVSAQDIAIITKKNKTLELIAKWLLEKIYPSVYRKMNQYLIPNQYNLL